MKAITKANSKRATTYNEYNDMTREKFIDRMLESSEEKGRIPRFAKEFDIETQKRTGRKSSFTFEHKEYIRNLLDKDSQLYTEDIIDNLSKQFTGLYTSDAT
ncbi:uncharacterized protein RHIMIDRAFT_240937 [Rhizopus microsporus ATCC 52813]|uniref:Uncharacterized protein n=1 Tax=Rhizopus microsporus ATCC 52813 TaxID=1340429 RepID=A0A2G4SL06_RHIZD|nr:uncharacterized protein RHIMIDRAFT_240937 [Rhizopus microsporus ATCC 52813]PHZ09066.1 hypothetical protein RHIMIDRAFT_240937 [Rhizopus microsporus ATCC 52813]